MITDDTGTVEKGHFEINTAFTVEFGAEGRLWAVPLIDFNFGTSRNSQLKIEIPYYVLHNHGQPRVRALPHRMGDRHQHQRQHREARK